MDKETIMYAVIIFFALGVVINAYMLGKLYAYADSHKERIAMLNYIIKTMYGVQHDKYSENENE